DHAGHTQTNVPDVVGPLDEGRDRQERLFVQQHGVDDVTNGDTDSPTGATLAFDDFGAAALGAFEDGVVKSRRALGQPGQRQPVDSGAGPDGHHRVAVFTEDEGFYLSGRQLEFVSDQRAKAGSVEHRAQAIDLLPGQTASLHRQCREDIDRVRDHKHVGVLAQSRGFDTVEYLGEEGDVAIDEVEPRLVGFAPQAGSDEKEVALCRARVVARINPVVTAKGAAVQQIECFAFGQVFVGVENLDFSDPPGALKREGRAGPDAAAAADDGYLHKAVLWFTSVSP